MEPEVQTLVRCTVSHLVTLALGVIGTVTSQMLLRWIFGRKKRHEAARRYIINSSQYIKDISKRSVEYRDALKLDGAVDYFKRCTAVVRQAGDILKMIPDGVVDLKHDCYNKMKSAESELFDLNELHSRLSYISASSGHLSNQQIISYQSSIGRTASSFRSALESIRDHADNEIRLEINKLMEGL